MGKHWQSAKVAALALLALAYWKPGANGAPEYGIEVLGDLRGFSARSFSLPRWLEAYSF
jgi:hypothetical protein